jgi:hypothetical protein
MLNQEILFKDLIEGKTQHLESTMGLKHGDIMIDVNSSIIYRLIVKRADIRFLNPAIAGAGLHIQGSTSTSFIELKENNHTSQGIIIGSISSYIKYNPDVHL